MTAKIHTPTARAKLRIRREPYWVPMSKGKHLGYRAGPGTWIARARTASGAYSHKALGDHLDYEAAADAARIWFAELGDATAPRLTVRDAIKQYVEALKATKTGRASKDAEQRLGKHVSDTLAGKHVAKLTTADVEHFRDAMVREGDDEEVRRSRDSANRTLAQFKAAMNLAFRRGLVPSDAAWRRVRGFRAVGSARKFFPTDEQIGKLLEKCETKLAALVRAAILTGARCGELTGARVADFDAKHGTLRVSGKTGSREVVLSRRAVEFFKEQAKDKLPAALLFTKPDGMPWSRSEHHKPFRKACKAAKLPRAFVFYSLRHYHISKALIAGANVQVIAENTGTSIRMIEAHYGKFLHADRRAMFDRVELSA